jgi:hypothetical protein
MTIPNHRLHPNFAQSELFIFGESFAGKFYVLEAIWLIFVFVDLMPQFYHRTHCMQSLRVFTQDT